MTPEGALPATFCKWRGKFVGMEASDAKRLRELEAEALLDNKALMVATTGHCCNFSLCGQRCLPPGCLKLGLTK